MDTNGSVLTSELIDQLLAARDADTRLVLVSRGERGGSLISVLDPDFDLARLPAIAEECMVSVEVLSKFRLWLDYVDQTAQGVLDPEIAPSPEQFADEIDMPFGKFEPQFLREVLTIRQALADEELDASQDAPLEPWALTEFSSTIHFRRHHEDLALQAEEFEATSHGMTLDEYREYLADLQGDVRLYCEFSE